MGHFVVSETSRRSRWWIPKYRFLELKYFCLQYPDWKREMYDLMLGSGTTTLNQNGGRSQIEFRDPTGEAAVRIQILNSKISLVGKIAKMSDEAIGDYILKAVTENLSFVKLKTVYEIPCERDMYYDRYRKFFYLLSRWKDQTQ